MKAGETVNNMFQHNDSYIAHIDSQTGCTQTVTEHLSHVMKLAEENCPLVLLKNLLSVAAILHDAGKLSDDFQKYMQEIKRLGEHAPHQQVDHSSAGGRIADKLTGGAFVSQMAATTIYSHHGLQDLIDMESGETLFERRKKREIPFDQVWNRYFDIVNREALIKKLVKAQEDIKKLYKMTQKSIELHGRQNGSLEFFMGMYQRLMLSLLMDADWSDAESFSDHTALPERLTRQQTDYIWRQSIEHFETYMRKMVSSKEKSPLDICRQWISDECKSAAESGQTLYRLTVPTGAGKTFSSLRFALYHAKKYAKRHIVYVAPYHSILEQNAKDIKAAVGEDSYVLEHHCNVIYEDEKKEERYKKLTENWDVPIIVTTTVQMLNTLFSAKKTDIRRMYSLCNSVLILDEIQAIPGKCKELFQLAVNFLSEFCGTTVILCSATQPSLSKQSAHNIFPCTEMVGDIENYAKTFSRVTIEDKTGDYPGGMRLEELAEFTEKVFEDAASVLVVLNTKKSAENLYGYLKATIKPDTYLYHLSTNMCPEHRRLTIEKIKSRLQQHQKVICVSTQLIEAGVNLSFHRVIRSLAGLDSVIQAAGRCNRHKELAGLGKVYIVKLKPNEERVDKMYEIKKAQYACEKVLYEFRQNPNLFHHALDSNEAVKRYYDIYYAELGGGFTKYPVQITSTVATTLVDLLGENTVGSNQYARCHHGSFLKSPLRQAFRLAGEKFEVISDEQKLTVVVAYDENAKNLICELENTKLLSDQKRKILRKLQMYTVGLSPDMRYKLGNAIYPSKDETVLLLNMDYYNEQIGVLQMPKSEFLNW